MDDRLQQLKVFLEENPNDPFLKYALATEYLKRELIEDALGYYEDLRSNHPAYVGTYYHLGKLYEALDQRDRAIAVYEEGIAVATQKRDMHARAELQAAYRGALGLDEDDDE